ncbi:MAG: RNA 2'-phosphotransferase [bacterium]|nr:RNA 2'-phosphotransferase [bacterium]
MAAQDTKLKEISKFISLILRHKPEAIGITLDEHGWANTDELIRGINKTRRFDMAMLEKIVAEDEKKRYSFNDDKSLIRANQGHSMPIDAELEEKEPPEILYHGTASRFADSIDKQGLKPQSRLYVHLSADTETARKVGARHGKPIIYAVKSQAMRSAGLKFYLSVNGVWLTKSVPPQYLEKLP